MGCVSRKILSTTSASSPLAGSSENDRPPRGALDGRRPIPPLGSACGDGITAEVLGFGRLSKSTAPTASNPGGDGSAGRAPRGSTFAVPLDARIWAAGVQTNNRSSSRNPLFSPGSAPIGRSVVGPSGDKSTRRASPTASVSGSHNRRRRSRPVASASCADTGRSSFNPRLPSSPLASRQRLISTSIASDGPRSTLWIGCPGRSTKARIPFRRGPRGERLKGSDEWPYSTRSISAASGGKTSRTSCGRTLRKLSCFR